MRNKHINIETYIETLSDTGKQVAAQIRLTVVRLIPEPTEAIKYNMPAFQIGGNSFLYFAVWKKHVGLYPIYRGDIAFETMVAPYRAETDTVQFALDQPLPIDVIKQIILVQAALCRR